MYVTLNETFVVCTQGGKTPLAWIRSGSDVDPVMGAGLQAFFFLLCTSLIACDLSKIMAAGLQALRGGRT